VFFHELRNEFRAPFRRYGAGGFSTVNLTLSAAPTSSWSIERALMMTGPWTNLGLSLLGSNGQGLFQDANPPAKGAFYRAAQP
jgi:hypothetical protein